MSVQQSSRRGGGGYLERPAPSGLADVIEIILDARIVIASVDTYLRFAEATNRLDLVEHGGGKPLDEFIGSMQESGAAKKVGGAVKGAKKALSPGSSDDDEGRRPARKSSSRRRTEEQ